MNPQTEQKRTITLVADHDEPGQTVAQAAIKAQPSLAKVSALMGTKLVKRRR